jgi:hypothetical protein
MVLTSNQLQLFTPIYDEFMLSEFGEEKMIMPQIFDVIEDKTYEWKWDSISGLGEWGDANEGEDGNYVDPVLGYAKTLTPAKKRQRLQISFEAVDRDEYALLSKEGEAKMMGRGANFAVEKSGAAKLYGGFTTAIADGQYLFDTDHDKNSEETGINYDNLLAGPLTHDNLELAEKQLAANMIAPDGIPIPMYGKPLIVFPSALKGKAARLFSDRADLAPGTPNNDINRFAGAYTQVEWRLLGSAFGGSDTAWYIVFPWMKMLKFVWQVKPHFVSWVENATESYVFSGRMIYDCGALDWRGCAGSTGL